LFISIVCVLFLDFHFYRVNKQDVEVTPTTVAVESATLQEQWMNQESWFKTLGSSIFLFAMSKNAKVAPAPATGANILSLFQRLPDAAKSGRGLKAKDTKKRQDAMHHSRRFLLDSLVTKKQAYLIIFISCYPGLASMGGRNQWVTLSA
jgi:hypothetical protein